MFIGAYTCGSALVYFVVLVVIALRANAETNVHSFRKLILRYSLLAFLLSALGLALFLGSSVWTSILLIGQPQEYRLPQDYVEYGVIGWAILLVAILGLLSPVIAAVITKRN